MKTHTRIFLVALSAIIPCLSPAATLSAGFDGFSGSDALGYTGPGKQYTESGLTFTSPTDFQVASGNFAATLFGWGGYTYSGTALHVNNTGWVSVSAAGLDLLSISFKYGFDWNGYMIEYGRLTTSLEFQFWNDGDLIGAGTLGESSGHGGSTVNISNGGIAFDEILLRSSATLYSSATWDFVNGGWIRSGPQSTYSNSNHLAFDDFRAETQDIVLARSSFRAATLDSFAAASVPEPSSSAIFVLLAAGFMVSLRRFLRLA